MKKTSRRNFSKAVAASLASLPLTSLAKANEESGSARNTVSTPQGFLDDRNQHDTPPPLLIADGSLVVEIDRAFAFVSTANGRRKYHRPRQNRDANLDHIKVIDGSGEILYRNDKAEDCEIVITLATSHEVRISGGRQLQLELTDSIDIGSVTANGPPRRQQRYRPSVARIKAIKVQKGAVVLYSVSKDDVVSELEEARIMVWHRDH